MSAGFNLADLALLTAPPNNQEESAQPTASPQVRIPLLSPALTILLDLMLGPLSAFNCLHGSFLTGSNSFGKQLVPIG